MNEGKYRIRREDWGAIAYNRIDRSSMRLIEDFSQLRSAQKLPWLAEALSEPNLKLSDIEFHDARIAGDNGLSAPIAAYLEISTRCNLRCPHCYKSERNRRSPLPIGRLMRVVDELQAMGVFELRITGLEPVISPRFEKVANYAKSAGFYMVVNTNGTYGIQYSKRILDVGFDEVIVSIDGPRDYHDNVRGAGSFDKASELLHLLHRHEVKTRINMVVAKGNLTHMRGIAELAASLGSFVNFLPLRTGGAPSDIKSYDALAPADMKKLVEQVGEFRREFPDTKFLTYFDFLDDRPTIYHPMWMSDPCPARKNLYISASGDTYHCDFLSYLGEKFSGGNLTEKSVYEIWHGNNGMSRYRSLSRAAKCQRCDEFQKRCWGGCPSEALAKGDELWDGLCFRNSSSEESLCVTALPY